MPPLELKECRRNSPVHLPTYQSSHRKGSSKAPPATLCHTLAGVRSPTLLATLWRSLSYSTCNPVSRSRRRSFSYSARGASYSVRSSASASSTTASSTAAGPGKHAPRNFRSVACKRRWLIRNVRLKCTGETQSLTRRPTPLSPPLSPFSLTYLHLSPTPHPKPSPTPVTAPCPIASLSLTRQTEAHTPLDDVAP